MDKNKNFDELKQRILYFAENQGIKRGDLYKRIGLSQSNFSGTGAESSLKSENIIKVLIAFPQMNPEWLLLGKGEMLRKSPTRIQNFAHSPACESDSTRLDDDITRGLIDSIQSLTHAIEKLTDKLCDL